MVQKYQLDFGYKVISVCQQLADYKNYQQIGNMSSPTRRQPPSVRPSYTQNRQLRQSINKFESISQRSPVVGSPRLNEQAYEVDNPKNQLNTQLKTKLEIVLKHNSQLLNENATLSEMVNTLRMEVDVVRRENQTRTLQVIGDMSKVMDELKQAQSTHQVEISKLLDEISSLHQQTLTVQQQKNRQIKQLKENHQRQLAIHIQQLKRSTDQGKDILGIQVKKLKETIELRDFELESMKVETKCEIERLKFQNKSLQNEIQHLRKLKEIEIKEVMSQHKEKFKSQIKEIQREKQLEILKREVNVKKLRKELNQKNLQIEQARKQGSLETQQLYDELTSAKNDKVILLQQLREVKQSTYQKLHREKERLTKMADMEKENMDSIVSAERQLLKQQREKVILLCIEKTHEIKRLYEIINDQKDTFEAERETLQNLINQFKQKLKDIELQNKEELELLKIKMAQLHEGDIKALEGYYENQVRNLVRENRIISEAHQADRAKLHKSLQQNDELRKNFQIEISKQKAKLQDMKVKFAAAHVQFKEQITSLGTKMQLTSQTLLRQTEQKHKGAEFYEAQKRKFFRIIQEKDKEIIAIQETMSKLKQINDEEIQRLQSQVNMLRDSLINKEDEFKNLRANLQIDFERKSLKIIEEAKRIEPDEEILKENEMLRQKSDGFQKDNFKKTKEIEFLHRQVKSLQGELGLRAGFIETMQLQSSAAIQDQKSKIKILMNQSEVAMKDYYESKLSSKEKDIENLKKQMTQKDYDLRAVISKYNTVEKKLKSLLQAQNKLSEFENKITNLGLDQNLVKNMAELFKKNKG